MRFADEIVDVRVRRRLNRFVVEAEREGRRVRLHLPNTGRMTELLVPGAPGLAIPARGGRTAGRLWAVRHARRWVSVDARLPNRLFEACLAARDLRPFRAFGAWQREPRWGEGRLDFVLRGRGGLCYVETKSCNLVERGVALFPDAPTARGIRHLRDLALAVRAGHRAAVVWFVQRDDARVLRPHTDPAFSRALAEAVAGGVEAYAYRCRVTRRAVAVVGRIPVDT